MKVIKLSQLRVGQRFSFIPSDWFGPARLSDKIRRDEYDVRYNPFRMVRRVKYDIKFDANVVNPPGVIYGISGDTKVRLLSSKPRKSSKGHHPCYVV
jgi:hypothetical protein